MRQCQAEFNELGVPGGQFSLFYRILHAKRPVLGQCERRVVFNDSRQRGLSSMPTSPDPLKVPVLPPLIEAYVAATNTLDLERLLETFADDALVNDQLRDYRGKEAIREWAASDIIGQRLAMEPTSIIGHYENFTVTANIDGNFDKRGLPHPLVVAFYFTVRGDRIVQLIILRNRLDI